MYELAIPFRVAKQLAVVQEKDHERMIHKLKSLKTNPRPKDAKKMTLKSLGDYRIRVGDWRIRYDVDDKAKRVSILDISRRDKSYK